jgi:trimeric autotransporter adhesin
MSLQFRTCSRSRSVQPAGDEKASRKRSNGNYALANGISTLNARSDALNLSTDLVQAGVVSTMPAVCRWACSISQAAVTRARSCAVTRPNIKAVRDDIAAIVADTGKWTLGGQALTLNTTDVAVLTNVEGQLATLQTAAAQTTNATTPDVLPSAA